MDPMLHWFDADEPVGLYAVGFSIFLGLLYVRMLFRRQMHSLG